MAILIIAIIYVIIAMAMENVVAIIYTKLEIAQPLTIFIISAFWILYFPAVVIYFTFFPKGHEVLAYILDSIIDI